jgi:polar amino acid transport system permease protein
VDSPVTERRQVNPISDLLQKLTDPRGWWAYAILALSVLIILAIIYDPSYRAAFDFIWPGVQMTMFLTITSFGTALVIGLFMGLARVSSNKILYNISTFYVETIRGVPILVQLLYVAFIVFPAIVDGVDSTGVIQVSIRDVEMYTRVILGLALAYGAFEAEVFRAGIESIDKGQMEAARSLGMSYAQAMRYVILPQAVRRVLPPLGNDFVAMLKDTSLASALAVGEITHLSVQHRNRTFTTFQPLNVAAFLYLITTLALTRVVRYLERRLSPDA